MLTCLELDVAEARRIAEPMMDDVVLGIARHDYALHSRHFSVALKSALTSEAFAAEIERTEAVRGAPGTREFLCLFRKPKSFTLVWDQSFPAAEGQVMAMMTVALKGGRYFVDYLLLH